MKQLTKKQKIDFCKWYLKEFSKKKNIGKMNFVCHKLDNYFTDKIYYSFSYETIKEFFAELFIFNYVKRTTEFQLWSKRGNESAIFQDERRLTIIAFVLAILETE